MAEKAVDKDIVEIRKLLKDKKLIIGTERTLKSLKTGQISKVFFSANCPQDVCGSIKHYSKLGKVETVKLKYFNDQLGVLCKKPFSISVLSAMK